MTILNQNHDYVMPKEYCHFCGKQIMYYADEAIVPYITESGRMVKAHELCVPTPPPVEKPKPPTKEEVMSRIPSYEDRIGSKNKTD